MTDPSQLKESFDWQAVLCAPESCARCGGTGGAGLCAACNGKGRVLVYQPSLKCPRCEGSGNAAPADRVLYNSNHCLVCRGTGWVLTVNE